MICVLKDKTEVGIVFDPISQYFYPDRIKNMTLSGMKCWVYIKKNWYWTPFSSISRTISFVEGFKTYMGLISTLKGFKTIRTEFNKEKV